MEISLWQPVRATLLAGLISLSACTSPEELIVVPLPIKTSSEMMGRLTLIFHEDYNRMQTSATRPGERIAIPLGQIMGFGSRKARSRGPASPLIPGIKGSELCIKGTAKGAQSSVTAIGNEPLCFHKTDSGWVYLSGQGAITGEKAGTLGQERTAASCLDTLEHSDEILRRGCARDLGRLTSKQERDDVAEALTARLADEAPGVREAAAETLGKIDCHKSFGALRTAHESEKNKIARQYMMEAIAICAGKAWLGSLEGLSLNQAEAAKLYAQGATKWASKKVLNSLDGDPVKIERELARYLLAKSVDEQAAATGLLFALDAQVKRRQNMGGGALHYAALSGRLETLKLLLGMNPAADPKSNSRLPPIHYAAREGHAEAVNILAQHGADVDFNTGIRGTPLHLAAQRGHLGVVEVLIKHGADVNAGINGIFGTPVGLARKRKYDSIVRILTIYGAMERDSRLIGSARKPRPEVIAYLQKNFPNIDALLDEIQLIMEVRGAQNASKPAYKQFEKNALIQLKMIREKPSGPVFQTSLRSVMVTLNAGGYDELSCALAKHVMVQFAGQDTAITGKFPYGIKRKCGLLKK